MILILWDRKKFIKNCQKFNVIDNVLEPGGTAKYFSSLILSGGWGKLKVTNYYWN